MKRRVVTMLLVAALLLAVSSLGAATLGSKADAGPSSDPVAAGWTGAKPVPNGSANSAVAQCPDDPDRFYVIGGWYGGLGEPITQTLRYDADTDEWVGLALLPKFLMSNAAVCYEDKIYLAGGEMPAINNDFYVYDIAADSWNSGPSLPRPVMGDALGAWDGKLYLVGGTQTPEEYGMDPVNQVDVYDIASQTWEADALPHMPAAASFPFYAQAGPYLYLVGGFSGDYAHNVAVTQRLDMATGQWESGPTFTSERAMGMTAITGQSLVAIGGDLPGGDWLDATILVEQLNLSDWPGGDWQDFGSLPEISQGGVSACTDALLGGEIWSTGGGYIDDGGNPHVYDTNLYHLAAEACVSYGVDLAPQDLEENGYPGEFVEYDLTITNTGVVTDYFHLSVSGLWPVSLQDNVGPLGAGMSTNITVLIVIPTDAGAGEQDIATFTAASLSNPERTDSSSLTTTVLAVYAPEFDDDELELSGYPGETVVYTLELTNAGNITDTITLSHTLAEWEVSLPVTSTNLAAFASAELIVTVAIPPAALDGAMDTVTVWATSQGDPSKQAASELTTTALWRRVFLPVLVK